MNYGYLIKNKDGLSTYFEERFECSKSNSKLDKQYNRIDQRVAEVEEYVELTKMFEIKVLNSKTGLRELKLDKIRCIHFLYLDNIFVFLGTFVKKTGKTPVNEIEKNNDRIKEYKKQKSVGGEKNDKQK